MMNRKIMVGLLCLACMGSLLHAQTQTVETVEHRDARMKWFREARFGMLICWGVYAVPAGEWKGQEVRGLGEWIMFHAGIPMADYRAVAPEFMAAKYDPKAWAKLAKDAGMKYVVITSKHHDGFALFDSQVSDWNAVKASGAKRDLIAPLAEAVRAEGLKFGLYYSQSQDWMHKGGAQGNWDPSHAGDYDTYLKTIAVPQVREIMTKFKPDVIWWDTPNKMTPERAKPLSDLLSLCPGIISNDRLGGGFKGDTLTPEQNIPPRGYPGQMFEVCMTMNNTWGYKKNDHDFKSPLELIQTLSDIASKGGNFLLNVGPDRDGVIPPESVACLQAMGKWMKVNGEAIYGTEASPFPRRLPWGRVTQKPHADGSVTVYLHVWDWPASGAILLPTLKELPGSARLMQGDGKVTCQTTEAGVRVNLPGKATDPAVSVVALEFAKPLTISMETHVLPGKEGFFAISPLDADLFGTYAGNIRLKDRNAGAYLSGWDSWNFFVEYQIRTPAAGKWQVIAEMAAEKPSELTFGFDKSAVKVQIPATGGYAVWKQVELGVVELPQGENRLSLRPVRGKWAGANLRTFWLKPVSQ